jgi:hypothetical protein
LCLFSSLPEKELFLEREILILFFLERGDIVGGIPALYLCSEGKEDDPENSAIIS